MHNEQKDILFEKLSAKLGEYESSNPTDADWGSFNQAYTKRKRKAAWFKLAMLLAGMVALLSVVAIVVKTEKTQNDQAPTKQEAPIGKEDNGTVKEQKEPVKTEQNVEQPVLIQTRLTNSATQNSAQRQTTSIVGQSSTPKTIDENSKSRKSQRSNTEDRMANEPETKVVAETKETASTNVAEAATITLHAAQSTQMESRHMATIGYSKKEFQPLLEAIRVPRDSTKYDLSKAREPRVFVDGGLLFTSTPHTRGIYPSNAGYNGAYFNAGYRIAPRWHIITGVQWGQLVSYDRYAETQTETQTKIARVDTTLKYHSGYNRIMMNIDTVTQSTTDNVQMNYSLNTERVWLAIPLMAQYELGNTKRSIGFQAGVITTQINTTTNTLVVNERGGQTRVSNQDKQWLFAPTIGIVGYQRIYKQVGVVAGATYLTYLPNQIVIRNQSVQLNAGLRVKF
jgi:hypothetical protein